MDTRKSDAIYEILLQKGFAESLCREIAYKYMNTDYTATRMLGYLYRMTELKEEQLVDEMIAILEDRDRIIKKHEMEQAQAAINRIYNEYFFNKRRYVIYFAPDATQIFTKY